MRISPLDGWTRERLGGLSLEEWQLLNLNRTLKQTKSSPYYRERLPESLNSLEDILELPFMSEADIMEQDTRLLCVNIKNISRIVSMYTSGTTRKPKRIYFTDDDIELTLEFFSRGLPTLLEPGISMAVMFPCGVRDGVGELICRGIRRIPAKPVPYGPVKDLDDALHMLDKTGTQSLVGMPSHILELSRRCRAGGRVNVKKVLLTADKISEVSVDELNERGWSVYRHYGMTEMGLGCAIDCDAHNGYHIREADLYLEIVDPVTGKRLPDGQFGEIVFTTLTRGGMPLIRYRTGDISAILPGSCSCGCGLRRLSYVLERKHGSYFRKGENGSFRA